MVTYTFLDVTTYSKPEEHVGGEDWELSSELFAFTYVRNRSSFLQIVGDEQGFEIDAVWVGKAVQL